MHDFSLTNFLRRIALAPNQRVLEKLIDSFPHGIPIPQLDHDLTHCYQLARDRLSRMEQVPLQLQNLMDRIQECFYQSLRVNSVLMTNLENLIGKVPFDRSCVDKYISAISMVKEKITFSDIRYIFGSDWGSKSKYDGAYFDPIHTLKTFYLHVSQLAIGRQGVQSQLWTDCGLMDQGLVFVHILEMALKGELKPPTVDELKELKTKSRRVYYPVGYATGAFFLHLISLDYIENGYRLRLLTTDGRLILPAGSKQDHYSPEVVWKGLTIEQLMNPLLWKPLLEVATLKPHELFREKRENETILSFDSTHLVPFLIRRLGKRPELAFFEAGEDCWRSVRGNRYNRPQGVLNNVRQFSNPPDEKTGELLLRPTQKEIRRTIYSVTLRKFVNLLPLDLIPSGSQMLLFKAESRLLLLVGAYLTLRQSNLPQDLRGNFLTLVENSLGKVTAPIERLMMEDPSEEEMEISRTLLATLLDLKNRLAAIVHEMDQINLAAPKPLYRTTHVAHSLDLSKVMIENRTHHFIDSLRLNDGVEPLPYRQVWTEVQFVNNYAALEKWYDLLLDAKLKCEPLEIILMAHQNVFSKLPIPMTNKVEDTFPDRIAEGEGLYIGTILLLKKICSLVASEIYSDQMIPPIFVADMTRVYRFVCEIYRKVNPQVQSMPISWYALYQYTVSRHSFHSIGDVRSTLQALVDSFSVISPKGNLRTSEDYPEIPLFYYSWVRFSLGYELHRKSLGPLPLYHKSVDEVLSIAALADSVGLRPDEIQKDLKCDEGATKWVNSFGGQCVVALEEIAEIYTVSIFASTQRYQEMVSDKDYRNYSLFENMGPEDHFQMEPQRTGKLTEYTNIFGSGKLGEDVDNGETPMTQRMVVIHDKQIREPISNIPYPRVENWRAQADLIKVLPKRHTFKGTYQLHQAASGPSQLSLDVLLEYFELRPSLLLNVDYRTYFWAIIRSQHVLETSFKTEPLLYNRFDKFIFKLYEEDRKYLKENNLNFERALWLCSLTRHLCQISEEGAQGFTSLLEWMVKDLRGFGRGQPEEVRLAPHMLASQKYLKTFKLTLLELARFHLIVGRQPPVDSNEIVLRLEVYEAMVKEAPRIQFSLLNGEEKTMRDLWSLILDSEEDVEEVMNRQHLSISMSALLKTVAQSTLLQKKMQYLLDWQKHFKKYSWRDETWREEATRRALQKVYDSFKLNSDESREHILEMKSNTSKLLCVTPTSLILGIKDRMITVDWETGRLIGAGKKLPVGKVLPVYLRKLPKLAPLGELLRRPLIRNADSPIVQFQGMPSLSLDTSIADAWITHQGQQYRLISKSNNSLIGLPDHFGDDFSVWLNENNDGIITAHEKNGTPHLAFQIDRSGCIRPLEGNTSLRLAQGGYYPEAELFSRWSILQKNILIWLDENNHVAELHLPLHNGDAHFTRVFKTDDGLWMIDGLNVYLEATNEAIPAFAGHPVYLVARNSEGQRLLLLPGATPYEIRKRRLKKSHAIDWNKILTVGNEEGIHQYRILPSGQIEGLTVADNLLLMLWTLYMGHYPTSAELALRWLTPPGRSYTEEEQRILLTWLQTGYDDHPMENEEHPSAKAIRLYVTMRMARHLRDYPPERKEGEKMPLIWRSFWGERIDSYKTLDYISEDMSDRGTMGRQIRSTKLEQLICAYDHESLIRLAMTHNGRLGTPLESGLYQRLNNKTSLHVPNATHIACRISGVEIQHWMDDPKWGKYNLNNIIDEYPTTTQSNEIPIERLYRSVVGTSLISFFDKAYTLIKEGPRNLVEVQEYGAVIHALRELHGEKMKDLCLDYVWIARNWISEEIFERNVVLWLILEQAFLAQNAGNPLPELPSIGRRFGVVMEGSKESAKEFFREIIDFSGMSVGHLLIKYRKEWFAVRGMRYFEQKTHTIEIPKSFDESLKRPKSDQLISEIKRWSQLSQPFKSKVEKLQVSLSGWSYPTPKVWALYKPTEADLQTLKPQLVARLSQLQAKKAREEKILLALANALPEDPNDEIKSFARQMHYDPPVSVDECIELALIGQSERWKKSCPVAHPQNLQNCTLCYLEIALEVAHLERAVKDIERCLKEPEDIEQMEQMLETLNTPHKYTPGTDTIDLMVSEYYTNYRLRTKPDQAHHIKVLTQEPGKYIGSVIRAIMGSGKSKKLAPAWLQMMLGTGRIPILCVPSSIFRTTLSDLQGMMWKRFRTHVRAFTFDRESCTKEVLYALAEKLYIARLEPTVFVCSPRDLHALQLMLKERHQVIEDMRDRLRRFTLTWAESSGMSEKELTKFKKGIAREDWTNVSAPAKQNYKFQNWKSSKAKLEEELKPLFEEANLLQAILNLLQFESALLVDEVAQCYDPRNLLSFPIGWQIQANPAAAIVGCKVYFEWLPKFYDKIDLLNNMQSLPHAEIRKRCYLEIAKMAWDEYHDLVPDLPEFKAFKFYLFSNPKRGIEMQRFVKKLNEGKSLLMKQYAQEIAFLKYCMTSALEGALTSTGFVNYGRSKQDPKLYLAIPYRCSNVPKENTLFRRPWKTIMMTCQHYSQCWNDPDQTAELIGFLQGIDPSSKNQSLVEAAKTIWGRRFGDSDVTNKEAMIRMTEDLDRARFDNDKGNKARLLIQAFLLSCVFPSQLKLDPSQLTSTPQDIPMMAAKSDAMGGTFGFETTWNPRLERVPDDSVDQIIISALKEPRNQTCHIIPKGGAESLFRRFESGALDGYMAFVDAGAIFKGISNTKVAERLYKALKAFDCILFWDEDQPGGARLAVMTKSGKTILEQSDKEGVRQALQKMNLKKPFAYYDQDRRIGYDLELPRGKGLMSFSNIATLDDVLQSAMRYRLLLLGFQSLAYVIPEEMEGEWTGNRVLEVADQQQKNAEEKANFHGICEQLRGEVRAKIDRAMRATADEQKRHELHKKTKNFLMEEQDNDLVKTFGALQQKVKSEQALVNLCQNLVKKAEQIIPENRQAIETALEAILAFHKERKTSLPEFVREGEELEDAVQEVDISKEQDRMRLMEEEYERMLGSRNPKNEVNWDSFELKSICASPLGSICESNDMPTLYRLSEALLERGYQVELSENLLISANLLSTFIGETNCLMTENQKPVHRGLLVRGKEGSKLVLVSENDGHYLKQHLIGAKIKGVFLVEPSGAINQRSSTEDDIVNLWSDGTLEERKLLLQAIIFQGSALLLDQLPAEEVAAAIKGENKQDLRLLFEGALDLHPEDMLHYRRSQKLRGLFHQ